MSWRATWYPEEVTISPLANHPGVSKFKTLRLPNREAAAHGSTVRKNLSLDFLKIRTKSLYNSLHKSSSILSSELSHFSTKTIKFQICPPFSLRYARIYKILASCCTSSLLPLPPPSQMATKLGFTTTIPRFYSAPFRKPFISVSSASSSFPFSHSCSSPASRVQQHFNLNGGRKLLLLSPKATTDQPGPVQEDDVVDGKILQYCSIDKKEKKSVGEMEQEFLQALQAFYYEGKAIMSNEEFDNLKEELMWEGSSVVMLSSDEQRFLEASMAYVSGNPIMSDEEFDNLKLKLKMDGSEIVVEGPRCSLRSRKVYSDLSVDYLKMFLLNVPAAVVALGLFFFLDDLTGFEITYLLELPEPFSFIFTWFAAIPVLLYLSSSLTRVVVKDFLILKGQCPNCGTENNSFFGTILSISSGGSTNNVKCSNCGSELVYDSKTRLITLPEGGQA